MSCEKEKVNIRERVRRGQIVTIDRFVSHYLYAIDCFKVQANTAWRQQCFDSSNILTMFIIKIFSYRSKFGSLKSTPCSRWQNKHSFGTGYGNRRQLYWTLWFNPPWRSDWSNQRLWILFSKCSFVWGNSLYLFMRTATFIYVYYMSLPIFCIKIKNEKKNEYNHSLDKDG